MHVSPSWLAALSLAVLPLVPAQDAKPAAPRTAPASVVERADQLRADFVGAWQLQRMHFLGRDFAGRLCSGYMLVLPEYLSMNTRMMLPEANKPGASWPAFSSGTHRWVYDESRLVLSLSSLLAFNDLNDDAVTDYEPAGQVREYQIELVGDDLTLSAGRDVRMDFRRLSRPAEPEPARKTDGKAEKPAR